jgi:thiol:disulfide interchange protein DsbD
LLLVGASAGRVLPKTGPWMETVKALFGVVFLGVAVWMLDRLISPHWTMLGWTMVAGSAVWVLARTGSSVARAGWLRRSALALTALYTLLLLASFTLGGTDPLHPTRGTRFGPAAAHPLAFQRIKTSADLDRILQNARAEHRPVMLDFSADWCVSCKEMDARTFNVAEVQAALGRYVVLRADVTANDADDQALLQRFGIFGPPTTAFFKPDGTERREFRLVGFVDADHFLQHLTQFEAAP